MNPVRKRRLYLALFLLVAVSGTTAALMVALEQNINMFYPPADIVAGEAPAATPIRAGGMVLEGSVQRDPASLAVEFVLTDYEGAEFTVVNGWERVDYIKPDPEFHPTLGFDFDETFDLKALQEG